jgi:amino acid transporter
MDHGLPTPSKVLEDAEGQVQAHSAVFKKELRLPDLVLTQILFVLGLTWVGTAGKLGHSHIVFWLLAIAFFYIPSAIVVIYLNRLMPLEGGLYQWARLGFNEFTGFMVGWNLWLYVIVFTSEIGLIVATVISYALGPGGAWIAGNKWIITLAGLTITTLLIVVSILGLGVGKWIHNAGGIAMIVVFGALIVLPYLNLGRGTITDYHPFQMAMPAINLISLNILGKMGFGALGGFEYVAILAGETRSPARNIGWSVVISAPAIALMFILGTSSVLAFVSPENIDLIGPIPQVLSIGFGPFGMAAKIVPIAILLMLGLRLAQASVNFTGNTRLPMVAGWDRLLPAWFTRLHPRYKTPVNSTLFVGAVTFVVGLAGIAGVGQQEAYQLIQSGTLIFYAITYLVMFAIPIIGLRKLPKAPLWLRLACFSGFIMTLLNVVLSIFPIIDVQSRLAFAAKILGVILAGNSLGIAIFLIERRKRKSAGAA